MFGHCFLFCRKKIWYATGKKKIEILVSKLSITDIGKKEVLHSLQNKKVNDFEDGLEYYAAESSNCNVIITEDINDFYFSSIPVFNSISFLEKHLI